MLKFITPLPVLALCIMSQAASAQSTTTDTTTDAITSETTQTAAETPATDAQASEQTDANANDELSMGEDATPAPKQPYIKEEHGDWALQCYPTDNGEEPCQMYQLLKDGQGTDVAEVSMFRLPAGGQAIAGATITVPLETLLTAQLTVSIDGGKGKRYPFSFCSPVGCYARIGLTAKDVAAFKKGAKATVTLVPAPAPDQKVVLTMSLKGFTAGFNASSVLAN